MWLPETYVRTRFLTRRALVDNTFISPSVTAFWQDHLGFGVTPQLEFGHPFAHQYIFVWANSATVYRNRSGFLWGTEVSLSKILSPATAIALAVGAGRATRPSAVSDRYNLSTNNYKISFKYRRRIYRPRLFLEVIPETNWRRNDNGERDIVPAITVRHDPLSSRFECGSLPNRVCRARGCRALGRHAPASHRGPCHRPGSCT